MSAPKGQSCGTCVYFVPKPNSTDGGCHLNPPVRLEPGVSAFAPTIASEWCGQWKPSLALAKEAKIMEPGYQKPLPADAILHAGPEMETRHVEPDPEPEPEPEVKVKNFANAGGKPPKK